MIEYSDRVLFGTDMGTKWFAPDLGGAANDFKSRTGNYKRYFDFFETDKMLPSDFVDVTKGQNGVRMGVEGKRKIQGLALPLEVLEKIYFRNAMRIYPHVKENLKKDVNPRKECEKDCKRMFERGELKGKAERLTFLFPFG